MAPSAGAVLVASPLLKDPNFARSVVFLLEHGERGTMGLVVNRPLDERLGDLWAEVPTALAGATIAADGGPVAKTGGLILHGCPDLPGAQELVPGLAAGGTLDGIAARFATGPTRLGPRLFLGHAGWGPGQLDAELDQGSWIVRHGRLDWVLGPDHREALWQRLV
ncbi:MAG: hypothetical protein RLZZ127_2984, partial [Planctomycetota bacterium]